MNLSSSRATPVALLLLPLLCASTQAQQRAGARTFDSADIKTAPEASVPVLRPEPVLDPAAALGARPMASDHEARVAPAALGRLRRIHHDRVEYDLPGDGSLWARGAQWKASFDAAGVTYYPAFGKRAPHNCPHVLSPDLVTVGGTALAFDREATAERAGDHVAIDRGAFAETYELAPQSIEEEFVFSELPRGGDLVVRIPIASELAACETADGFEFRSDLGRVVYGRATAIDARGRRVGAVSELVDGAIEIRVDAAFLDGASLPVVIDPLITSIAIDVTSDLDYQPDAAYDALNQVWLVVYAEYFSGSDVDVYQQLLDASGAPISGQYIDITGAAWEHPRCANLANAAKFLVVASVTSGTNPKIIRGRWVFAQLDNMGPQLTISGGEFGDLINPDVGGDPSSAITACWCVVYERVLSSTDTDIIVRLVGPDGTTHVGPDYFSNSASTLDEYPSVSKSNDGTTWLLAWQRDLSPHSQIWAGRMRFDGTVLTAPFSVTNAAFECHVPCASSPLHGTQRAAIAFEEVTQTNYGITIDVFDGPTAISGTSLYNPNTVDQLVPSIDSDGQHFTVVYAEAASSASEHNIYATDYGLCDTGLVGTQYRIGLGTAASDEEMPRIASAHGAGGPARRYLAVWERIVSISNDDIYGALLDAVEGGPVFGICFGDGSGTACPCGNNGSSGHGCANSANATGANVFGFGEASTITDSLAIEAFGMPATTSCLFFQGTALSTVAPFGDGLRCVGGSVIRLGTKSTSGGSATYPGPGDQPVSVRGAVPVNGATRYYQVWYRNAAAFCTSSTFNTTNALIVEWAR